MSEHVSGWGVNKLHGIEASCDITVTVGWRSEAERNLRARANLGHTRAYDVKRPQDQNIRRLDQCTHNHVD